MLCFFHSLMMHHLPKRKNKQKNNHHRIGALVYLLNLLSAVVLQTMFPKIRTGNDNEKGIQQDNYRFDFGMQ